MSAPPPAAAEGERAPPPRRARLPHPRARHRARARAADRRHRDPRAALRRDRLAAQPRAQRVDLRDPRRRPDARDHHAQRRPLGRLGASGSARSWPATCSPSTRAWRCRSCSCSAIALGAACGLLNGFLIDLGPGAGARRDARHALRVPRPRVPVDQRAPGQRRDAARRLPQHRHRHDPRRPVPGADRARRGDRRRPVAARLPRRAASCTRSAPTPRARGSPACARTAAC